MTREQRRPTRQQGGASDLETDGQPKRNSCDSARTDGLPTPTPDKTTDPRPQSLPWYLRIPPGQWFCDQHGLCEACPEHDCPHCFVADYGYGECAHCDSQITPPPPVVSCPNGEDCPVCPECFGSGLVPPFRVTCACTTELCPECWHCPDHVGNICATCRDRNGYDRNGDPIPGRAYCEAHGWVTVCPAHDTCPDRYEDDLEYGCTLKPYSAASPSCRYCQGVGPCKYCHVHCPGCWADSVLLADAVEDWRRPPPCEWCEQLVSDQMLQKIERRVACVANPDLWLEDRRLGS